MCFTKDVVVNEGILKLKKQMEVIFASPGTLFVIGGNMLDVLDRAFYVAGAMVDYFAIRWPQP